MSSFRACSMANRVVLIHDMDDRTIISELDLVQADLLLEQLQHAVSDQIRQRRLLTSLAEPV